MPEHPILQSDPIAHTRSFPQLTESNEAFWTSGASGNWKLPHCSLCNRYIHPGQPRCPYCLTNTVTPKGVTGLGNVFTYTINRYPWSEGWAVPYVAAVIELDDQPGLRVTSNLTAIDPEEVHIGMRVEVCFVESSGRWVPLFRPAGTGK
ncbi:Zn-ribbon domain-containing OB-fold protein [Rhodococcus koreensis]